MSQQPVGAMTVGLGPAGGDGLLDEKFHTVREVNSVELEAPQLCFDLRAL